MSKMHSAKKLVIDFILVMLGNAIMALGTAGFAVPAKIILGGVSGLALAFQHYVFYVHLSTLVLVINVIVFIAGYFLLWEHLFLHSHSHSSLLYLKRVTI